MNWLGWAGDYAADKEIWEDEMAKLTAEERRKLPKNDFAVPSKAPGPGSYPIPDRKHAAVAKGYGKRFASSSELKKIDKKANKKLGSRKKA